MATVKSGQSTYTLIDPLISTATVDAVESVHAKHRPKVHSRRLLPRSVITNGPLLAFDTLLAVAVLCGCFSTVLWLTQAPHNIAQLIHFHSALAVLTLAMSVVMGLHRGSGMNPVLELRQQVSSITAAHILVVTLSGVFGSVAPFEVAAVGASWAVCCFLQPIGRAAMRKGLGRQSWWGEPVVLVGDGDGWLEMAQFLRNYPQRGLKLVGSLGIREALTPVPGESRSRSGTVTTLGRYLGEVHPDWVIVAAPEEEMAVVRRVVSTCGGIRNIVILNGFAALPTLWTRSYECAGMFGIHMQDRLLSRRMQLLKRTIDIVGALAIGAVALPLMIAAAILIRLRSPGPVFYQHLRVGRGGRWFKTLKFRTMVQNADRVLDDYLERHPDLKEEWERNHKLRYDPRIIPFVGRLLRVTSLDELPQLWNVLRGEMSLVGPRPIVSEEIGKYQSWYSLYTQVRPGLTGLWQVSGRNGTSYEDRVRLDAYYVMNWSPWMDMYILLRTIRTVLWCEGAC